MKEVKIFISPLLENILVWKVIRDREAGRRGEAHAGKRSLSLWTSIFFIKVLINGLSTYIFGEYL